MYQYIIYHKNLKLNHQFIIYYNNLLIYLIHIKLILHIINYHHLLMVN